MVSARRTSDLSLTSERWRESPRWHCVMCERSDRRVQLEGVLCDVSIRSPHCRPFPARRLSRHVSRTTGKTTQLDCWTDADPTRYRGSASVAFTLRSGQVQYRRLDRNL